MPRPLIVRDVGKCGNVQYTGERVHGVRWYTKGETAVLLERLPWGEVRVLTWCPAWFLRGPYGPETLAELELEAHMKRRTKDGPNHEGRAGRDPEFQAKFPTLFDYLTATCFDGDNKQPRITSTLLLFAQDLVWKACLRDRSEGVCAWVAAPELFSLLAVLEEELAGDTAVWRLDRLAGAPEASRKPSGKRA